ncbi:hypothetical protein FACS189485_02110 [Spirochaetia bacterium]|nr:hypothetical protein FACS189485_02110 [Spirochaetia bacterium]
MNPGEIPSAKNFNGPHCFGKKNLSFMAMLHKRNYRGTFILEKTETEKGTYEAGLYAFTDKMEEG